MDQASPSKDCNSGTGCSIKCHVYTVIQSCFISCETMCLAALTGAQELGPRSLPLHGLNKFDMSLIWTGFLREFDAGLFNFTQTYEGCSQKLALYGQSFVESLARPRNQSKARRRIFVPCVFSVSRNMICNFGSSAQLSVRQIVALDVHSSGSTCAWSSLIM